jgi:ubiquinone/menaquinone biosynthesis C-methylase UbiE
LFWYYIILMGQNTRQAYEQAAEFYDAEPNSVLFTETRTVLEMLALGPDDVLLDAACGTGKYLAEALKAGAAAAGLDFSEEMLRRAGVKCPGARLLHHDLERLPLPFGDGEFSKIAVAHALRHVGGAPGLFSEFARLLGGGGALVVTITHPAARFDIFKYRAPDLDTGEDPDLTGERHAYSREDLLAAAASAGLAPAGAAEICVDERLVGILTESSYAAARGTPLILALKWVK